MGWLRDAQELFQVALVLLCGGGCGFGDPGTETWVEQVRLQTGETIAVEREFRYGGGGSKSGPLRYARMEFDYRGKHYRWEEEHVWPMVLQVDERGRVVVASGIVYESAWHARGKPCDWGVFQINEDGVWKQYPSAMIHVSSESNLAGNKKNGLNGVPMSKAAGSLSKRFGARNSCLKEGEMSDVQPTSD